MGKKKSKKQDKKQSDPSSKGKGRSKAKRSKSTSPAMAHQSIPFPVNEFGIQSSVDGKFLYVIKDTEDGNLPTFENSFDLRQGISVSYTMDDDTLHIGYGDFPVDPPDSSAVPPPIFRQVPLHSSLSAIHFNIQDRSLNLTGVGSVDLITTDPVEFNFMSTPMKKLYTWIDSVQPLSSGGDQSVSVLRIDHIHLQFAAGEKRFWNVTVYFKEAVITN